MNRVRLGGEDIPKSMRTAFIRVTEENLVDRGLLSVEPVYDIVRFTKENILTCLEDWSNTAGITYWFIEHAADEEVSKTHYHIVIKFKSPMPFENVKARFPFGDIQTARNLKASIQYLVHLNDSSKQQYPWSDIHTNCKDMTPYMIKSDSNQEVALANVIMQIDRGEIREYNQFERIPIELWAKHRSRIENSLTYYREKVYMDKDRLIEVWFFSGATGTGKTTFAKYVCKERKLSYCISSSSNDPLQDYKGEDVLILDDLRDDSFKFVDLLKILDNHTRSTSRSRYHNKAFIGELIIITSAKPLSDWYFEIPKNEKRQLYRRIPLQYKFEKEVVKIFEYNEQLGHYVPQMTFKNLIAMGAKKRLEFAKKTLENMGIELTPMYKAQIEESLENNAELLESEFQKDLFDFNETGGKCEENQSKKKK